VSPRCAIPALVYKLCQFILRPSQEGRENIINIADDEGPEDDQTFRIMIEFMYRLEYEVCSPRH
jgi:hypothetical protein